jgi:hypothetical protein
MKRNLISLMVLTLLVLILCACAQKTQEHGVLEGHVTIGPLAPVVRQGEPEPTPAPEVYAAREVVVFDEDGKTEFTRLKIDAMGDFRAELPAGAYAVDTNHSGIDIAKDLPKVIVIAHQGITRLDIDIDTGIR